MPAELQEVAEGVYVREMITVSDAIDLFDGYLAGLGRAKRTRDSYVRILDKFCDRFPRHWDIAKVTEADCEAFKAQWSNKSLGTQGQVDAPLRGLFRFLYQTRKLKQNPMELIPVPKRQNPEDLNVLSIDVLDVPTLLREARLGAEQNCLYILALSGARRHATSQLTVRDYKRRSTPDGPMAWMRFHEKGGKTIWKPVAHELREVLDASMARGELTPMNGFQPEVPYLIPPEAPLLYASQRDDRVIWRLVKKVAGRCGLEAHTHALRAAFAEFYLLNNPGDQRGLQYSMGHSNPATTEIYLRKFDKRIAMEPVRSLSWLGNMESAGAPQNAGKQYEAPAGVGAGGFEPPSADSQGADSTRPRISVGEPR